MKKTLLVVSIIFSLALIDATSIFAQAAFNTGELGVTVNSYGRVRIYTPDTSGIRQLERMSILVGIGPNAVFDYQKDAEEEEPTVNVANPLISDHEIYGSYNNSYSFAPPDIFEKLNVYGWNDESFIINKYTIVNRESATIEAIIGMDIIPYLDEVYGYDTVTYDATNDFIRSHRDGTNLGYKLLSHNLSSLYSFEWFSGYHLEDSSYWNWMTYGSILPQYISNTADGPVIIPSQEILIIAPDDSVVVYYAIAIGTNETDLIANMQAAEQKYISITSLEQISNHLPAEYLLEQNYPNPFNPSTAINFGIPNSGFVSLKIYDLLGRELSTLVNEELAAGNYKATFEGSNLPSGIYFYTLTTSSFSQTRKMNLIK